MRAHATGLTSGRSPPHIFELNIHLYHDVRTYTLSYTAAPLCTITASSGWCPIAEDIGELRKKVSSLAYKRHQRARTSHFAIDLSKIYKYIFLLNDYVCIYD